MNHFTIHREGSILIARRTSNNAELASITAPANKRDLPSAMRLLESDARATITRFDAAYAAQQRGITQHIAA